jgi:hypothetical protein
MYTQQGYLTPIDRPVQTRKNTPPPARRKIKGYEYEDMGNGHHRVWCIVKPNARKPDLKLRWVVDCLSADTAKAMVSDLGQMRWQGQNLSGQKKSSTVKR